MTTLIHHHPSRTATPPTVLDIAYTPDSDDVFNFYGWEHGPIQLETPGYTPRFRHGHIIALNRAAQEEAYDVLSISSVAYPALAQKYAVLAVGNSIGRGYGPVLVSKHFTEVSQLVGKTVAVAGIPTTGGALAMMYCPGARFVEEKYDRIADGILAGRFDAGVMIHEELLFYPEKGLNKVRDLGAAWTDDTGLPLPVGLNVVRRALGDALMNDIARTCRASLAWGFVHYDEAFACAEQFGRGCASRHVEMFSNDDTAQLQDDVRQAMGIMFRRVAELGLGPRIDGFEVIDG